ncbi:MULTISPECIES: hypothetical protein [unclassified Pseudomonas]|uniref:hypothetical protein n=1 Tax=unclassified Pseudomonas TaxID=196821 RepID=UPI0015B5A581|nr:MULTISPECIES: hypothetical protein [unclassified Pseudomonas]
MLSSTSRHFHLCVDIEHGVLSHANNPRALDGRLTNTVTGAPVPGEVVLAMASALKAQGYRMLPACNHHDAQGLCLGHEIPQALPPVTDEKARMLQAYGCYMLEAVHDFDETYRALARLQAADLDELAIAAARARFNQAKRALALPFDEFAATHLVAGEPASGLPVMDRIAQAS